MFGALSPAFAALLFAMADAGSAPTFGAEPAQTSTSTPARAGAVDVVTTRAEARGAALAALAEGNRLLNTGKIAEALLSYRRAQSLYPEAAGKVEFNIGKAEAARQDDVAAVSAFERFLALAPAVDAAGYRAEATAELERLLAGLGSLQVKAPRDGLTIAVDGLVVGKTPLANAIRLHPGRHVVTLEESTRVAFRQEVEVQRGETLAVVMAHESSPTAASGAAPERRSLALAEPLPPRAQAPMLSIPPPPADASSAERPLWRRWWFWAAAITAVAAGTVAVYALTRSDCPAGVDECAPL